MGRGSLPDETVGVSDGDGCVRVCGGPRPVNPLQVENVRMWESLPGALLQKIFQINIESARGWAGRRKLFTVNAVCRSWRLAARELLVQGMWKSSPLLMHPAQLFILSSEPVPGGLVKCCIRREDISGGLGPPQHRFNLYLCSRRNVADKFLIAAVQHSRHAKMMHLSKMNHTFPCAKLLSNLWSSNYRLSKRQGSHFSPWPASVGSLLSDNLKIFGIIKYKLRMKGILRPRRLSVWLPNPCKNRLIPQGPHSRERSKKEVAFGYWEKQGAHSCSYDDPWQTHICQNEHNCKSCGRGTLSTTKLVNKLPQWNEGLKSWCLNFRGRVKLASVKNFQLMQQIDSSGGIVMQFGKVDTNFFIMDYNPTVITAIQAFGIALTSFDSGVRL